MNQETTWEVTIKTLRLHFLQGNSHIDNIEEWIDQQVIDTINTIRKTTIRKTTKSFVDKIKDPKLWTPKQL